MSGFIFPFLAAATGAAGSYAPDASWRIVLHTTQIRNDPRNWVGGWRSPSHVVADYERQVIVQCVDLALAAKSLWNEPGGVETNRQRCVQVEINGFAEEAAGWSQDKLRWLGREVIAPIVRWIRSQGGNIDLTDIPEPGAIGGSAYVFAPQRMTYSRWATFNGICGHRHVPENDHWDGGGLDMRAIALYAAEALGTSVIPLPVNLLEAHAVKSTPIISAIRTDDGSVYLVDLIDGRKRDLANVVKDNAIQLANGWSDLEQALKDLAAAGILATHTTKVNGVDVEAVWANVGFVASAIIPNK